MTTIAIGNRIPKEQFNALQQFKSILLNKEQEEKDLPLWILKNRWNQKTFGTTCPTKEQVAAFRKKNKN